jgi:thymidine phosphorylase
VLAVELIRRKRDGESIDVEELAEFVAASIGDGVSDEQLAAFFMAVYFQGLDRQELLAFTEAMIASGRTMSWETLDGPTADKHSTGGVGDKISLIVAPLVAEQGIHVPMMAGRGLGHTGGTLDKMEAIDGYRTDLDPDEFLSVVDSVGCAIVGQTEDIAPADRRYYAIRDTTATIESIPLIVASIMSKKLAEGAGSLILDVKVGSGAFMRDVASAQELAEQMISVGNGAGVKTEALLTRMDRPLGTYAGNSLEVLESIEVLRGERHGDVRDLTLELGAMMVASARGISHEDALAACTKTLDSGHAFERFKKMVVAQGGSAKQIDRPQTLPGADEIMDVTVSTSGIVESIDTREVGMAVVELGGGRRKSGDTIDPGVGVEWLIQPGDKLQDGDLIARVHARDEGSAERAEERLLAAIVVGDDIPVEIPLIHAQLGGRS